MNVRIIAGLYGSRVIDAPDRRSTHAMGERIRNALFNSLGHDIEQAKVLDAFAGSGSVGIEALSRGAKDVVFIEKDRIAAKIIQKNLDTLGITQAKVVKTTVSNWLETSDENDFSIVFADPPYHDPQLTTVIRLVERLQDGGIMVVSLPTGMNVPSIEHTQLLSVRDYGNASITIMRKRNNK